MTPDEKSRLSGLRKAGRSYTETAARPGISKNTVKIFLPQKRTGTRS